MQRKFAPSYRRDILLLLFSVAGILGLAGWGIIQGFQGSIFLPGASISARISSLLSLSSLFFCAALLLPLLVLCVRKLAGKEIRPAKVPSIKVWQLVVWFLIWLGVVILCSIIGNLPTNGGLIAAPFFLMGIGLPIGGLAWIAIGGLPAGSWRRLWAAFGIGMAGSTAAALFFEYLFVGIFVLGAGILAAFNPGLRIVLQQVWKQATNAGDIQTLLTSLAPYLTNPLVLLLAFVFAAGIAPIIEETLKPAAVWLLGKRLRSPAEGFALGALCGAGFAMLEGMQAGSGMAQMLGIGLAARAASSLMHITASGLLGWAIASARLEKRYGRLAWTYLLSVGIHGLWNGSVVLAVFGALRLTLHGSSFDIFGVMLILSGVVILGSMLIAVMIILPIFNRRLRSALPPAAVPPQSDIIAPLQP